MSDTTISGVIQSHGPQLMALEHVVGVGESRCNGQPCIRVYLAQADHDTLKEIPAALDGITVIKEISGPLNAQLKAG